MYALRLPLRILAVIVSVTLTACGPIANIPPRPVVVESTLGADDPAAHLARALAPVLYLQRDEWFQLSRVVAVVHPNRQIIGYYLLWRDVVPGAWRPYTNATDDEIVWVGYDSTGAPTDVWTYWHGKVLHADWRARGTVTITDADGGSADGNFTAVFVKEGDDWKIDSLEESVPPVTSAASQELNQLAWMIGEWTDTAEDATIRTVCEWSKNHAFITRAFSVEVDGQIDLEGTQVIGWDPAAGRIRSWVFDSDGGFAEATWTKKNGRWFIQNQGVLADGRKAAAVNVIKPVDDNSFTWQTISRTAGGELLPNVDEVLIVRQ